MAGMTGQELQMNAISETERATGRFSVELDLANNADLVIDRVAQRLTPRDADKITSEA